VRCHRTATRGWIRSGWCDQGSRDRHNESMSCAIAWRPGVARHSVKDRLHRVTTSRHQVVTAHTKLSKPLGGLGPALGLMTLAESLPRWDDPAMVQGPVSQPHCEGTVVVHEDRSLTCTNSDCNIFVAVDSMVSWHARFLACRAVFTENGCPRCAGTRMTSRQRPPDQHTRGDSPQES
jgi:hypothetical protein